MVWSILEVPENTGFIPLFSCFFKGTPLHVVFGLEMQLVMASESYEIIAITPASKDRQANVSMAIAIWQG